MVRRHLGRRHPGGQRIRRSEGKIGYVQAPVKQTKSSGWLYAWSWTMEKASKNQDAACKFISWASRQEYENLVGKQLGWAAVPAGKRASTYANPDYNKAAAASPRDAGQRSEKPTRQQPGVSRPPTVGIQFVDVPEFTDLGDKVTASCPRSSPATAASTMRSTRLRRGQTVASNYK